MVRDHFGALSRRAGAYTCPIRRDHGGAWWNGLHTGWPGVDFLGSVLIITRYIKSSTHTQLTMILTHNIKMEGFSLWPNI